MPDREVRVIDHQIAYQGYFRIDRWRMRHSLHGGGMGPEVAREVFERGSAAALLPLDARRERVVLIEQFRPGAYAAGWDPWLIECVAGIIEPGESTEDVVRRETEEEAGLTVLDLEPIAHYFPSPGGSSETVHLYCGRVDAQAAGGIHGLPEEGEDIRVLALPVDEALALLDGAKVCNAMTLIALQWLKLHWPRLRARWGV